VKSSRVVDAIVRCGAAAAHGHIIRSGAHPFRGGIDIVLTGPRLAAAGAVEHLILLDAVNQQ